MIHFTESVVEDAALAEEPGVWRPQRLQHRGKGEPTEKRFTEGRGCFRRVGLVGQIESRGIVWGDSL